MEYLNYIMNLLNQDNNPTEYHKKTDEYIETVTDGDLAIPFASVNETDRVQEFVQDTCDYFVRALNGRPLKYVTDLRHGMARIGDGVEEPLFWCMSLKHPVGFMLDENGFDPVRMLDLQRHGFGRMSIYTDADVKVCIDTIVDLLKEHRNMQLLESDEEKENHTKVEPVVDNSNIKRE